VCSPALVFSFFISIFIFAFAFCHGRQAGKFDDQSRG
jgi:hypothetical protein